MALTRLNNRSLSAVTTLPTDITLPNGITLPNDTIMPTGSVLSVSSNSGFSYLAGSGTTYANSNIKCAITTTSANSKILFIASLGLNQNTDAYIRIRLLRNDTLVFEPRRISTAGTSGSGDKETLAPVVFLDSPNVSAGTELLYWIQARDDNSGGWRTDDNAKSAVTILEIKN